MKPLLVFDLDDTLYLERDYVYSGFHSLEKVFYDKYGIQNFGNTCWDLFLQGVRGNTFQIALEKLDLKSIDQFNIPELVQHYRTHTPTIKLLPDATQTLSELHAHAHLALLTDGCLASQRAKVQALGLEKLIDEILYTDEHHCPKPSPQGFWLLQQKFRTKPEYCAYFGDNPRKDFDGPATLGWKTYRIKRPLSLHEKLTSPKNITAEITCFEKNNLQRFWELKIPSSTT